MIAVFQRRLITSLGYTLLRLNNHGMTGIAKMVAEMSAGVIGGTQKRAFPLAGANVVQIFDIYGELVKKMRFFKRKDIGMLPECPS